MNNEKKLKRKFLLNLIKPYRKYIALMLLLFLLASAFDGISIGMLVPLLAGIQQVQNYEQLPAILQYVIRIFSAFTIEKQILLSLAFVVASILLKNILLAASHYLGYWLTARLIAKLRLQVVNTLMFVGIGFYNTVKSGDLIDKVIHNTVMTEEIIKRTTDIVDYLISFLILLALLVIFSWKLTIVTILLAAVIAYTISLYIKKLYLRGQKLILSGRSLTSTLQETLTGIQVIKSFTKEREQFLKIGEEIENHASNHLKVNFSNFMVHVITEAFGVVAIGILFLIAIESSQMDYRLVLTQLLPFIYILARILPLIKQINQARGIIVSRWPALEAVHNLTRLDDKPVIPDGDMEYTGLREGIKFSSVSFSYNNDEKLALRDASFFIPKGKTTALVGKSGSGKSTVINLLLRFYDPQGGQILIDGEQLVNYRIESYRRNIGIVSQDTFIFNDSVRNNIAFGLIGEASEDIVMEAARRAGADEFIVKLPEGYDTILGDRGIRLSGGQRQRISIARAILKNPEILILDEATSSLDSRTEELIHRAITELSRNRTVIIIAHRLSTIKNADQIIVLKDGKVSEIGEEKNLLEQKGEFFKLATTAADW